MICSHIAFSAIANPVVPSAELGPFKHGTYPSLGNNTYVGVDLVAPCGSSIYTFADGVVEDVIATNYDVNYNSLGYMVLIRHPIGLDGREFHTIYLHMQSPPLVSIGQSVQGGSTEIGKIGDTGSASGCHTHFEVRFFPGRFSLWGNIYPPGDVTKTNTFLFHWKDPEILFKKYPSGITASVIEQASQQTLSNNQEAGTKEQPENNTEFFLLKWIDKWHVIQQMQPEIIASAIAEPLILIGTIGAIIGLFFVMLGTREPRSFLIIFYGMLVFALGTLVHDLLIPTIIFVQELPLWVIFIIVVLIALRILQTILNLIFGPDVAPRVIAELITGLIMAITAIVRTPFRLFRRYFPWT